MLTRIEVNPSLLVWAGERSGIDTQSLEARFPRLSSWRSGDAQPIFRQLEKFARATHTAFGYFLMESPPDLVLPIADFRALGGSEVSGPGPNLLDTIHECTLRQSWYHDYLIREGAEPVTWIGKLSIETNPMQAAQQVREALNYEVDSRKRFADWSAAFSYLIRTVEGQGALVMVNGVVGANNRRKLDPEDFRGFSLVDDLAPLIFVNGADTRAAQIFTLIHEYAHLCIAQGGVSNASLEQESDYAIERWCNAVAAEVLAPAHSLQNLYPALAQSDNRIGDLAKIFRCSGTVVLYRLLDLSLISRAEFGSLMKEQKEKFAGTAKVSAGGNFYATLPRRVSPTFASAVVSSALSGQTDFREAKRILGIAKTSTFDELARRIAVA